MASGRRQEERALDFPLALEVTNISAVVLFMLWCCCVFCCVLRLRCVGLGFAVLGWIGLCWVGPCRSGGDVCVRVSVGVFRSSLVRLFSCFAEEQPCVSCKRPRVYFPPVCHMTHTRFDGTHGGVLNVHTEERAGRIVCAQVRILDVGRNVGRGGEECGMNVSKRWRYRWTFLDKSI